MDRLTDPDTFIWATGIEDTFITAPWPKTGRTLDEYELTGHYERWHEDIGLMKELGVRTARYGIPWHRIQPEPHRWDWTFTDQRDALGPRTSHCFHGGFEPLPPALDRSHRRCL